MGLFVPQQRTSSIRWFAPLIRSLKAALGFYARHDADFLVG
jgi:hypothetical protein